MDKYAARKWSFAELVACAHENKKAMTYTRWLIVASLPVRPQMIQRIRLRIMDLLLMLVVKGSLEV